MWQKVAKFKGAEYFRKALYIRQYPLCVGGKEEREVEEGERDGKGEGGR